MKTPTQKNPKSRNPHLTPPAAVEPLEKLHALKVVAERAGVALSSVYSWAASGLLPTRKLGRRRLVSDGDLRKFLAGQAG